MNTEELLKKIKRIELKTKGLTKHVFSGEYHSSFKGRGMAFSEVREYQIGDEVRTIDWNVTARFNAPFIKVFEEERELTLVLLIDLSDSMFYGSQQKLKKELLIEIAAVLAFSAEANNDKVGAIFFTDKVEKYLPPAKGKKHILHILRDIMEMETKSVETDINEAMRFYGKVTKKRSIGIMVSDFISETPFLTSFNLLKKRHDLIALKICDPIEYELPNLGKIQLFNAEKKLSTWVNTSDIEKREKYKNQFLEQEEEIKNDFKKNGIAYALLNTANDYIPTLIQLFQRRK